MDKDMRPLTEKSQPTPKEAYEQMKANLDNPGLFLGGLEILAGSEFIHLPSIRTLLLDIGLKGPQTIPQQVYENIKQAYRSGNEDMIENNLSFAYLLGMDQDPRRPQVAAKITEITKLRLQKVFSPDIKEVSEPPFPPPTLVTEVPEPTNPAEKPAEAVLTPEPPKVIALPPTLTHPTPPVEVLKPLSTEQSTAPLVELSSLEKAVDFVRQQLEQGRVAEFQLSAEQVKGLVPSVIESLKGKLPVSVELKDTGLNLDGENGQAEGYTVTRATKSVFGKKVLDQDVRLDFSLQNNPADQTVDYLGITVNPETVYRINVGKIIRDQMGKNLNEVMLRQLQEQLRQGNRPLNPTRVTTQITKDNTLAVQVER